MRFETAEKDLRAPAEELESEKSDDEGLSPPVAAETADTVPKSVGAWRGHARQKKMTLGCFLKAQPCSSACCSKASQPRCARHFSGSIAIRMEKGKQALRPLHSSGWEEWEVIEAILDSGASVIAGYPVQASAALRAGVQYEIASGDETQTSARNSSPS